MGKGIFLNKPDALSEPNFMVLVDNKEMIRKKMFCAFYLKESATPGKEIFDI